jgi:hypothetical protein
MVMNKLLVAIGAMATFAVPSIAQAQMVRPQAPATLVSALQDGGYKAELTKDDSGDPMIKSSSGGTSFSIFFYGCTDNKECSTVQFYAGFSDPNNASLRAMNDWNRDNRFGRAYLGDDGSARIEMDVDMDDGGISKLLFADNVEFWEVVMSKFEDYVNK